MRDWRQGTASLEIGDRAPPVRSAVVYCILALPWSCAVEDVIRVVGMTERARLLATQGWYRLTGLPPIDRLAVGTS